MADSELQDLTADTAPADGDIVLVVVDPAGTPYARKMTVNNLLKAVNILGANTAPLTTDTLLLIDDPGGTPTAQQITLANLLGAIAGSVVINEGGADYDTRVEGDTDANLLYVDAGADKVGIGTATPDKKLDVAGVIQWTGAGTVPCYLNQGAGNNMQIMSNVDESNVVTDATKAQWKMFLGSAGDYWQVAHSPVGATYTETVLSKINGVNANFSQDTNVIRMVARKTAIADNSATNMFTITTVNETGSTDGGVYSVKVHGVVAHGSANNSGETSCKSFGAQFCRAINAAGGGNNSAVTENLETASAASTTATKDLTTVTMTVVETSEYVQTVQFLVDCTGTTVTTADITLMVELVYIGFLTPPVIASA